MIAMTRAPRLYCASSEASGRFTLMMMSASFSASALTVAPTAVNSESGRPDLMPAPGSIATSTPSALNFFTVSGDAATRGSDGSISLATAIFMGPPLARTRRLALFPVGWIPVLWPARGQIFRAVPLGRGGDGSGQEDAHHGYDEDHGGGAVLHQHDETFIGLLMRFVVVAVGGGVGHFAMVCHRKSPVSQKSDLASHYRKPASRATARNQYAKGLLVHWEGQLSLIQRVSPSSFTSPAASARKIAA